MIEKTNRVLRRTKSTLVRSVTELSSRGRGPILILVAVGWLLSIGTRLVLPTLLPYVRNSFDLDLATAGLLLSLLWMTYALFQFPAGMLTDYIGERIVLILSTVFSAGGILIILVVNSTAGLFVGIFLLGMLSAFYGPARYSFLTDVFPNRSGTAISFVSAVGSLGNSLLPIVVNLLAVYFSWRAGFGFLVPLFIGTGICMWYLLPRSSVTESNRSSPRDSRISVDGFTSLFSKEILFVLCIQILISFIWSSFTGFYPTYLIEEKLIRPSVAGLLYGLFFGVGAVVQQASGISLDKFGIKTTLSALISVICISLVALVFTTNFYLVLVLTVTMGSLLGVSPLIQTYFTQSFDGELQNSGLGLVRTIYISVSAVGPLAVGLFADAGHFDYAIGLLSAFAAVSLVLCNRLS